MHIMCLLAMVYIFASAKSALASREQSCTIKVRMQSIIARATRAKYFMRKVV